MSVAINNLQVSWSLTQERRPVNAADHQHYRIISTSVRTCVADDMLPTDAGEPLAAPHQPLVEVPRNRASSTNVEGCCGSSTGEGNPAIVTNTNHKQNSHNIHNSGRDSSSSSSGCPPTVGVDAAPDVGCCAQNPDGSRWELRQHFPPDALVPRAPLNSIVPVAPVVAATTAVHKAPTQTPLTSPAVPATDTRAPLPATPTARPKMSENGAFPLTPTRRRPTASERARARPYSVRTGLHELGLAWKGGPKSATSEMRAAGLSPIPGRLSKAIQSPGAADAIGEGKAATTQHGGGSSLENTMTRPRGTRSDLGAQRGTADGKGVVGLTAEVIKSPGVALDRSGRVTVVDKVTQH